MTAYQLHDSETEEILGCVIPKSQFVPLMPNYSEDEIFEGWTDFNKLEETELNPQSVDDFVKWFNENYVTQIERIYIEFVQPSNN